MIIITDCLTEKQDEGCVKVANQLTLRLKRKLPETTILSFRQMTDQSDLHMNLNRLFLNRSLATLLRSRKEPVLYIPFSSNTAASVLRTFILSLYTHKKTNVLFTLRHPMHSVSRWLLKRSGARVVVLSEASRDFFRQNGNKTVYIKAGVDTARFVPITQDKKQGLRDKYHIPRDKTVVLHVGHLKAGRNVRKLLLLSKEYHVILVCSPRSEQDPQLRNLLEAQVNITVMDRFLDSVEELYQLSDVYFFPVQEQGNCIDAPLSVLEAAACNIPVVTTDFGELSALRKETGFLYLSDLSCDTLNDAVETMSRMLSCDNRSAAAGYDWELAADQLIAQLHT